MQILFLSRWFPFPPNNGSKLRVYNLLKGLVKHHELTLLSFLERPEEVKALEDLDFPFRDVRTVLRKPFEPYRWRAMAGFFSTTPRYVLDTFSSEMASMIRQAVSRDRFDLVIASQEGTAVYGPFFAGIPSLFEEIEIATLYDRYAKAGSFWPRFRHRLTWVKQKRYLARQLEHFDACTVVSESELELLGRAVPSLPVAEVIPNCIDLDDYKGFSGTAGANRLIFTGSFRYEANHEAMVWFVREVLPRVQQEVSDVELLITGDHAGLTLPEARNVTLSGYVDDVRPLIASSSVSLAPIHSGGGTRLKILEAMALQTPVIATSKGAEGLDLESGRHLLVADSPAGFAEATVRLLRDPELGRVLAKNAFGVLQAQYDWEVVMPRFLSLINRIASGSGSRNG